MPIITTKDGTDLYVKDWGAGRPVVLLHGWPLTADSWDDHAYAFASAGYRVIAYDRRGFGRSSQPWTGYDYDTFADDLATVIDTAGVSDATVIGFSMGGGEVARYASRHGSKGVAQYGLIASVAGYVQQDDGNPDGVPGTMLDSIKTGIAEDRPHYMHGFIKKFYGVGYVTSPVSQEVIDWSMQMAMVAGLKGTIDCVDAFGRTDFRPDLPAITVPTLVIHGTADQTVPIDPTARVVAAAVPSARLIEYDGSPHGLLATDKQRIADDVLAFLRG